jgi:hypothetical protein
LQSRRGRAVPPRSMAPISVGHGRIPKAVCAAARDNGTTANTVFSGEIAHLRGMILVPMRRARRRSGSTGGRSGRTTARPCDSELRRHWSPWLRHQEQQRGPCPRKGRGTTFRSWCSRIRAGRRDPYCKRVTSRFRDLGAAGAKCDPWRWKGSAFQAGVCAQLVQKARVIAEYKLQFRCYRFQDASPIRVSAGRRLTGPSNDLRGNYDWRPIAC